MELLAGEGCAILGRFSGEFLATFCRSEQARSYKVEGLCAWYATGDEMPHIIEPWRG